MRRVGVVHPNTLVGRELREGMARRAELFGDVRLLSADEDEVGQLAESGGAAAFVGRLDDDALEGLGLVFFCGAIESDRPWIDRLPAEAAAVVLSLGAGEEIGPARIAGIGVPRLARDVVRVPHPAAVGASLLLARLAPFGVSAARAVALLPVSTRGEAAIDELFEQTRALLAFRPVRRAAGRAQSAFNVAPAADDAQEVARQVGAALGADFPFSIELLEAGVFHGIGLALHVELAESADAREIRRALAGDPRIELARRPASVSPAALAGSERLTVGEVRADATPGAFWIWTAFDNLTRGCALVALELAEEILDRSPRPS